MRAKAIIDEVRAEVRRRYAANGGKRLPPEEESELRKWKIARYTEAIQLDPSLDEAYAERGTDFYFERRYAEAQSDMRKAFSLRPKKAELYMAMSFPFEGDEERKILEAGINVARPSSFEHEFLRDMFIKSYWYEGNFVEYVRLLEDWIPKLDRTGFMHCHALQGLAGGYSALGQHATAEAAYRQALSVGRPAARGDIAEMIIRTRMHRGEYEQARQAIKEFRRHIKRDKRTVFDAAIQVLMDPASEQTKSTATKALTVAEPLGRAPGPLANKTSYYSFLLGLIYKGAGRHGMALELLKQFALEFAANKREWAITMRWEIAMALEAAA